MADIFDQDPEGVAPEGAPRVAIIPVSPTDGPDPAGAILEASPQVELFDEEFWDVPKTWFDPIVYPEAASSDEVADAIGKADAENALPIVLSPAEEALLPLCVGEAGEKVQVLHFSARSGMGKGHPLLELVREGHRVVSIGLRELTVAEATLIDKAPSHYSPLMAKDRHIHTVDKIVKRFSASGPLAICIDVSVFDASVMPATEKPEPGGLSWSEVTEILRETLKYCAMRGGIITGLRPHPALHASDFLVAKLLYKLLTYEFARKTGVFPKV